MKVIHIESGLGNQMLSYSELLLLRKLNPSDEFYIETIIFDIPQCSQVISQWNGYELQYIFGIEEKNIKAVFNTFQWNEIMKSIVQSEFWLDWNYPQIFVNSFNSCGLKLLNYRGGVNYNPPESKFNKITNNRFGYFIKRIFRPFYEEKYIQEMNLHDKMFIQTQDDIFTGQWLGLMRKNSGIENIEQEIRSVFVFKPFLNTKNIQTAEIIKNCNSVAIHARRGDAMQSNGYCYRCGYFKRAIAYIKKHVVNPVFFFFTDTGSMEWCRDNEKIFGLNMKKDEVYFIDWNSGTESYRDMQMMSLCKHNVITFSSFGWWGAWLNNNPHKITCSPSVWINTTHHF